jgi:multiple sugar transport system ATP-binding protein
LWNAIIQHDGGPFRALDQPLDPGEDLTMGSIRLEGVSKTFAQGIQAVQDIDLEIANGEFMVLVGPSGCGKSTLLRLIAGLEEVTEGSIRIGGEDVTYLQPTDRDIAMVFQNYALYPHLTVRANIGFGLRLRKMRRAEIDRRVDEVAQILGLEQCLDRKPAALSGGQRQRVAMGRAMVREPRAFLMDEPLSNLDSKLRVSMRAELTRLHERLGVTTVYVTHDQVEAMTLGNRVAVLRDGVLQQCDAPQVLYDRPANLFVAGFIGSPSMNLAMGSLEAGALRFAGQAVAPTVDTGTNSGPVIVGIRPSDLELGAPEGREGLLRVRARVEIVEELGSEIQVILAVDVPGVAPGASSGPTEAGGDEDWILAHDTRTRFIAQLDGRGGPAVGAEVELTVDPTYLHLFSPGTGRAIGRGATRPGQDHGGIPSQGVSSHPV